GLEGLRRLTLIPLHVRSGAPFAMPGWRNWQTRRTQNPVLAREWEFDPPSGHHRSAAIGMDDSDILRLLDGDSVYATLNISHHNLHASVLSRTRLTCPNS